MNYIDRDFAGNLDAEAAMVNLAMKNKGFHDDKDELGSAVANLEPEERAGKLYRALEVMHCLSQHALIVTEVAELSEAIRKPGTSEHLSTKPIPCSNCNGTGYVFGAPRVRSAKPMTDHEECIVCRGAKDVAPSWKHLTEPVGGPAQPPITGEEEECADILIRLLHYCGRRNLRLGLAYQAKTLFNDSRPHKHGKLA